MLVHGNPSVHGAVLRKRKSYGAVWCSFNKSEIPRCGFPKLGITRCGSVWLRYRKSYGAVRCGFHKSQILRCGSAWFPDERFSLRCGSPPVGNIVQRCLFSTVNPMNRPWFRTVLTLSRGTKKTAFSTVHRTMNTNRLYKTVVSYGYDAFSQGTNETGFFQGTLKSQTAGSYVFFYQVLGVRFFYRLRKVNGNNNNTHY